MTDSIEVCAGCGEAQEKPTEIVGVFQDENAAGDWYAAPVCKACHNDPLHRKVPLKCHFFPRSQATVAVDAARRQIMLDSNNEGVIRKGNNIQ